MKEIISKLNKSFENRVRLGIMSVLMANEWADFNHLKELLDATDGNLAGHLTALEKTGFIEVTKTFVGRKPNTRYAVTEEGKKAFREHLENLGKLIQEQ